jgi:outer membrane autotransporter protein
LILWGGATFDFAGITPAALGIPKLLVNGMGATINAGVKTADFSNGSLFFDIPDTAVANDKLLIVTGSAKIDGTTSVGLDTPSGRPSINYGEKLILLDATALTATGFTELTVKTASGDTYKVLVAGNELQAILQAISPDGPAYERLKAYAESQAAQLAFLNQGADLLLNQGFGSALSATSGSGFSMNAFAASGGGKLKHDTGSHAYVSGFSMMGGIAVGNEIPKGRITVGGFFESGWGKYDSYNSFSAYAPVHGMGNSDYFGIGALGRYDVKQGRLSGLYLDSSVRLGRAKADFRTGDIEYNGWSARFETSSVYFGMLGGVGYVWNITSIATLDLSAKFIWTHQGGDSLTVYMDRVSFKASDSLRSRLGGRFGLALNEYVTPYVGAYWDREYDGKARSTVNGHNIDAPSLKGNTGMGEVGLSAKPTKDLALVVDLGLQGYVGQREGVTGSLQARFEF